MTFDAPSERAQVGPLSTNAQTPLKKVGIIGAGPAGLSAAMALRKQGLDVHVYDQAKVFRPIGAGLTLSPNGLRSLAAIDADVVAQLKRQGAAIKCFKIRTSKRGWPIITQRRTGDEYDQPFMAIRWFCLQETLRSQLPPENLHLNHRLTGFEQTSEGVTLCFKNNEKTTVDLLIGADGIRSAVRKQLLGVEAPPYSGWMTWRGVLKYQHRLLPPNQVTGFGGKGKIFILFDNGDGYISWSLEMLSDRCDRSNTAQETKARVLQELEGWHPVVQEVIGLTDADIIVERPVHQPVMLSQWSGDRVTLVGDAAHAMGPHMGQSTNTAFEDVRALSVCLAQVAFSNQGNLQAALEAYEKGRIERTIIVQHRTLFSAARMFKPFLKAKKFQSYLGPLPEQAKLGEKAFSDWLYGYDLPA